MLEKILVPLDGSEFGEQALPLAESLARMYSGVTELHLVHVHVAVPVFLEGVATLSPEVETDREALEREYLASTAHTLEDRWPGPVHTALLQGPADRALDTYAEEQDVGLVVMSTHGRGGVTRVWLGGVADRLMRRIRRPLLVFRPEEGGRSVGESPWPSNSDLSNILVPLDGSTLSERILPHASTLATETGASLQLLRVLPPLFVVGKSSTGTFYPREEAILRELEEEAEEYLDGWVQRLEEEGLKVEKRVLSGAEPAKGILEVAREEETDLIAMATHGRSGVPRAVLGSVADKVVRGARRPVLAVRPQEGD